MPVMSDIQRSLVANTTTDNVLAGKQAEFLNQPSAITFLIAAAAKGVLATVLIGDLVLVEQQEVSRRNAYPIAPDDVLANGFGNAGERVIVRLNNTTGAAILCDTVVQVEAVG